MAEWIETFKGAVLASEYDAEGYMNSPLYVSRFDQATWFLLHSIGLTPASIRAQRLRLAIFRQNYQFIKELRGGELVLVKSGFVAVGEKYLRFLHQMLEVDGGEMLASCDCTAVLASLDSGKSVPLTPQLREGAKAHMVSANLETEPA